MIDSTSSRWDTEVCVPASLVFVDVCCLGASACVMLTRTRRSLSMMSACPACPQQEVVSGILYDNIYDGAQSRLTISELLTWQAACSAERVSSSFSGLPRWLMIALTRGDLKSSRRFSTSWLLTYWCSVCVVCCRLNVSVVFAVLSASSMSDDLSDVSSMGKDKVLDAS